MTLDVSASPWLLVRTKPKQEAMAAQFLTLRGLQPYCPRVIEPPSHPRAPKGPVPLFPSYVFCRADLPDDFSAITFCPGVRRLVRFGDRFAMLSDVDVDFLKQREGERGYLVIPRVPPAAGDFVRLTLGPFSGFEAIVESYLPSHERVRLLLRLASGTWRAVVPASDVKVLRNGRRNHG